MSQAGTLGDALRVETLGGEERGMLVAVGTIPGVVPLAVSGFAGDGTGALRSSGDGMDLSWRAPGSSTFGLPVRAAADGDYILGDGEDRNTWFRVRTRSAFFGGPQEAVVFVRAEYGRLLPDVDAATAENGDVLSESLRLRNMSGKQMDGVKLWSPTPGVKINDTVAATEETAVHIGRILAGGTQAFFLDRVIVPGRVYEPREEIELNVRWDSF